MPLPWLATLVQGSSAQFVDGPHIGIQSESMIVTASGELPDFDRTELLTAPFASIPSLNPEFAES
jgi:hypothetical protein